MYRYRCYHCGFETKDRGMFLGNQGDGHFHWVMFICPQCATANPPVAEVDRDAAYKLNAWELVEADDGLRVFAPGKKGGGSCSPIHPQHPLLDASASLLSPELEGTLRDHSKRLKAAGDANKARFNLECQDWERYNPKGSKKDRIAFVDRSREQNQVGPHSPRKEHNGPALMREAGLMERF